ncbi:MAG: MFS transporter [Planctomycetota bacterium]|nr:MFS transporter [Planctomycetota bacterium]
MEDQRDMMTPSRRRLILVAMTGSLAMIMMDTTVVGVALPEIAEDLGLGESGQAWVVNAYLLTLASLIAVGGRIGDLIGKGLAFRVGVSVFALASLGCGLSSTGEALVGFRVLQAVGAVLMQPASSAIVVSTATPGREGRAMGVYIGISMLALVAGPVLGGTLTTYVGWSSIFYINLPIAVFALLMAVVAKPPALRDPTGGLDLPSVLLLVVPLPLLVVALQESGEWGFVDPRVLGGVAVGIVGLLLFLRRQGRVERPLVNVALLRDRGFLADAAMLGFMQFALVGAVIHLSILTQTAWEFDPQQAGFATLPLVLPVVLLVQLSGRLYDRFGVRPLAMPGTVVACLAVVGLGISAINQSLAGLFISMVLLGLSMPFVTMPANTDGRRRVGEGRRGLASGLLQTVRMVGGTLGVATTAAVSGGFEVDPASLSGLDCAGVGDDVLAAAASGDPKAFAVLSEGLAPGAACLEAVRAGISRGIGWGFVVAGLVAGGSFVAATRWRSS